ncbi:MAG TPA: DUF2796 domain-containing protein [Hyphomicrobiaceae bacterium]|nr:DUF2796 domain-containing protein [Hyphomicrobiaceae bacterium]
MRIIRLAVLGSGLGLSLAAGVGNAQQRQLGAHEHGRGTLNLAIEGTRVSLELEVPAADIIGFEHVAKTPRQKAAVAQAKKQLLAPQALFKFPGAAGCVVADASVDLEADGEHEHEQAKAGGDGAKTADAGQEANHSNFHAQYSFTCKTTASITVVEFGYFQAFAGAQKLEVNVITAKGQSSFEVTRTKPRIDLASMM